MCTSTALAMLCLAVSPAHAAEMNALEAKSIALGRLCGIVYYTSEENGYRVVATVQGIEGLPVRFVATLAENQAVAISVPGRLGESSQEIEVSRAGGTLVINREPAKDVAGADCALASGE